MRRVADGAPKCVCRPLVTTKNRDILKRRVCGHDRKSILISKEGEQQKRRSVEEDGGGVIDKVGVTMTILRRRAHYGLAYFTGCCAADSSYGKIDRYSWC